MDTISHLGQVSKGYCRIPARGIVIALIIFVSCNACRYKDADPIRNEITFDNPLVAVEDSLVKMVKMMSKLQPNDIVIYYIDKDLHFYVNNSDKGVLSTLSEELLVDDVEFTLFSTDEVSDFISLVVYLEQNNIYSCQYDGLIEQFIFGYRRPEVDSSTSLRGVVVIFNDSLITNTFEQYYKVLDRKGSLVLISSN
jgi:hypothetical protein